MIQLADYEKKLVIPRWLNHAKAVRSNELSYPLSSEFIPNELTQKRLAADYLEFKQAPTPHKAADLMGAAFVIGNETLAKEIAKYIKKSTGLQNPIHKLADHLLGDRATIGSTTHIRDKIAQSKLLLNEYPRDPIGWMERARCYTIKGQIIKAEKCVRIALNLAPADRYIVRSAVRFYLHSDKIEQAWYSVKRALEIQFDPWIKATEINISEVLNKSIKKLKGQAPIPDGGANLFYYSELIESYGMLELINGNDHRAKKYFRLAWANPSHNVVTHSEWIVRAHFPSMADIIQNKFSESMEASAWSNYNQLKIDEALVAAVEWGLEEPYAKNAFSLGSSLAFQNNNNDFGLFIVNRGLETNPADFGLQNNLCYGLLKLNKIPDAERAFAKIEAPSDLPSRVVYSATKGLLEYKRGNIELGRNLYVAAIAIAKDLGDRKLFANALLNFAIAEVESNTLEAEEYSALALRNSEKIEDGFVIMTRQILNERLSESKEKKAPLPFKEFSNPKIIQIPKF